MIFLLVSLTFNKSSFLLKVTGDSISNAPQAESISVVLFVKERWRILFNSSFSKNLLRGIILNKFWGFIGFNVFFLLLFYVL